MNTHLSKLDLDDLKHDIQRLVEATSDVADETVTSARKRLSSALEKAGHGAECAGKFVMDHRREACLVATVAVVAGVAAGLILTRNSD